jgi:hypothetical protein
MSDRDFQRLARRIRPDEDISNRRALREIVGEDATVKVKAIPSEALTALLPFSVTGSITASSSVAQQWAMPAKARIRLVRVLFKTAPGVAQQISLMAAGAPIVTVAVASGQTDKSQPASEVVEAGTLMEIKASASSGSNLSVSVWYEPGVS